MKWKEARVIFDSDDKEVAEDLISNVFYDLGLKGVVAEDPDDEPVEGWGDDAPKRPDHYAVIGYFPQNELADKRCQLLEEKLARLEKENGIRSRVIYHEMDEEDWAESWKQYFRPEKISEKIIVKPTWTTYNADKEEIVLDIDPGMAFGTGTHPTTSLCIKLIEKYIRPKGSFLDVGTGSGILMVAAAKLGAEKVWGIDTDEVAVEIAERNLLQNNIDRKKFKVMAGSLVEGIEHKFDMVVSNILSEVILVLLESIKKVLVQDGIFICSGIIEENKDKVLEKMKITGFEPIEVCIKEAWVSIAGKLKK
jgi:ribosomal protein L11 methyltransferase